MIPSKDSVPPDTHVHTAAEFVIFFTDNLDPENPTYETTLQDRIAESCQMGRHTFDSLPLATS
jgi:hypothetical protein